MNDSHLPAEKYYPIALQLTRIYEIGLGFGVGWIASSLAGLFGAGLTGQWWAFYVPVMMSIAFAASGFVGDMLPIPRPLVYLVLLAVGFYVLAQEAESLNPQSRGSISRQAWRARAPS